MLAGIDKGEDFGTRRIRYRKRLHHAQPFGKDSGSFKELLIERSDGGKPLTGKFPALHANDIETFKSRVLAVYQTVGNDVAANAADTADHGLRPNSRELMHGGQTADEDEVADLAVTAKRRGGGENDIVTDLAIVSHMA